MKRIPTLDGWRGIAILLVIFDHLQLSTPVSRHPFQATGTYGVALFFVLSGFLITSKLIDERQSTGKISLRNFYIRRFFRLMPAAWVFLLSISVLGRIPGKYLHLLGCLLFVENYVTQHHGSWVFGHFWSLSIEEQFYLFWPAMFIFMGKKRAGIFAAVISISIALYRFNVLSGLSWSQTAGTEFHADALLIGCLSAMLPRIHLRAWYFWPLIAAFFAYLRHPVTVAPFGCVVVIALLLLTTTTFPESVAFLEWRLLKWVGTLSYSLYLWQQVFVRFPGFPTLSSVPFRLCLTLAFSILSYTCIEQPCIRFGTRFLRSRPLAVPELVAL